ncbi:MAG: class I SAM-dependent methyltransferase [Solirubrobacterales bacterium]|nr:class I SAM-dependent methyltransferase [Solirubrobacterales bacterium]
MSAITDEVQALKDAHRKTWASGDYARVAELVTEVGETVVKRAGVRAGSDVLDVAAGTGNASIPAARAGARVIATDLTPELFTAGRRRAQRGGVELEWLAADAEDLPFEDERFDFVLSSLGVQFAPRHELVASELVRVCRPGGVIVLGNWAADGYIGRFWTVMGPYMPPPPDFASPPAGWGSAAHVALLFAEHPVELTFERYTLEFVAESPAAFVDTLADFYGPLVQARNKLAAAGRWEALRDELIALSSELNQAGDNGFQAPSEYLVILARRRK